jgi:hypothetical protein
MIGIDTNNSSVSSKSGLERTKGITFIRHLKGDLTPFLASIFSPTEPATHRQWFTVVPEECHRTIIVLTDTCDGRRLIECDTEQRISGLPSSPRVFGVTRALLASQRANQLSPAEMNQAAQLRKAQ